MSEPVDIILLSYNRVDYLAEMVDALEQRTHWPYRLSVVDNASGPATRQWLRDNAQRFHQILWNERNEHLAAFQRGIAATTSERFVISDADLVVAPPTVDGCWLTRLNALAQRHPDFGLIGVRLDSVSQARNAQGSGAPLVDGEILETATGVWLNLVRREALRVPFMSDGITGYALRRAGYRVGIAADVWCTHLGDQDPWRHPDYLARKQAANGWGTTYPDYPERHESERPPSLRELALAAPVLVALERHGLDPSATVELSRAPSSALAAVDPRVRRDGAATTVAVIEPDADLLAAAFASAGEWVVALGGSAVPQTPAAWSLVEEMPGPHPVVYRFARVASRERWRRVLGHSTSEYREAWVRLFRAACFGDTVALRVYVLRRERPLAEAPAIAPAPPAPRSRSSQRRHGRVGALATKVRRLIAAEWHLRRER